MRRSHSRQRHLKALTAFLTASALASTSILYADARDEAYWRTFYLTPIGAWGAENPVPSIDGNAPYPQGIGNVQEYRQSMLQLTGGVEPKNVRVGISNQIQFLAATQNNYYDYIFEPNRADDWWTLLRQSIIHDIPMGVHLNGFPWADTPDQSIDNLANYLELFGGGAFLARDRNGNFRLGVQDPSLPESYDDFAPQLEMQTTLSRNATYLRQRMAGNLRMASRIVNWHREAHPDLIIYNSASSEYAQSQLDNEWFDYSDWSRQEFRDWLSGGGLYAGNPQFASLAAFNAEYQQSVSIINPAPAGFPYASWDAVQPPTNPTWNTTNVGRWWQKWQQFRIHQVASMVQFHQDQVIAAGWSPDRTYGHQIPFDPTSTNNMIRRYATPWTTTFTHSSSNGITTYGGTAASNTVFAAIYANDKNWGIFEHNRLSTDVATNLTAINNTWNNNIHILTPYAWGGQETYRIQGGSAYELALRQFFSDKQNDRYTGLQRWEAHPDSRDIVWSFSRPSHVALTNDIASGTFNSGRYSGTVTGIDPYIWLELDGTRPINANDYGQLSFRLNIPTPISGFGQFFWIDENDNAHSMDFTPIAGEHIYYVNLVDNPSWRNKKIKAIRIDIPAASGSTFALDWIRLHGAHVWNFAEAGELLGAFNLSGVAVGGGNLSATTTNTDGHIYLAMDQAAAGQDADRVFIDGNREHLVKMRYTSSAAGTGELFWWRRGDSNFGTFSFAVSAGTNDYTFDMSGVPGWEGQITQFRLDPVDVAGANINIDYIGVYTPMMTPRPTFLETITNTSNPYFEWNVPEEFGVAGIVYDFEIATDWEFSNIVYSESDLTEPNHLYTDSNVLDGLHYWRVRSRSTVSGLSSEWSFPLPRFFRIWDMTRSQDLVAANDFSAPTVSGGVWSATTTGSDPYFFFNTGGLTGSIVNADHYRAIRFRIKIDGPGQLTPANVFIFPRLGGFHLYNFNLYADSKWHEIEVDLTSNPGWDGEISLIRLDPTVTPGLNVSISHAELVPRELPASTAQSLDYPFETDGDFMGWSPVNDITNASVSGGALRFDITGADPFLESEPFTPRDGNTFRYLLVRLRNTTASGQAQFFWRTASLPFYDGTRSVTFPVSGNDSDVREYVIDMAAVSGWAGQQILELRFDPINTFPGGPSLIEIDRIALTHDNPASPSTVNDWMMLDE